MKPGLSADAWDDVAPARSVWLITLADLGLLLVGFFVLLHADRSIDRRDLLAGLRAGFGVNATEARTKTPAPTPAMAVASARVEGFAHGSTRADASAAVTWARGAARDPRTRITVTGSTEGAGDVDPATGSAAILAADRARMVAVALARSGAVDPSRIVISITPGRRRAVTLTVGFAGDTP